MARRQQRKETQARSGAAGGQGKRDMKDQTGAAIEVLKQIEAQFPNNPRKQWSMLMEVFPIQALTGRAREVGYKTLELNEAGGHTILTDLRAPEVNIRLQNISEFNGKHAMRLIRYYATTKRALQSEPDSASSLQALTTVMRRICTWNGRPNAVPKNLPAILEGMGLDPQLAKRKYVATVSKAPRARGVDPARIVARARAEDATFGLLVEGALLFGFREREALEFRPGESDEGDKIRIFRGVKNGNLTRFVDVETAEQRDWLERAKAVCKKHEGGILTWQPMKSIEQAIKHLEYRCLKIGLTKKGEFKSTFHGLRHQFAQDLYKRCSGYDAPVVSGLPVPREIDAPARQKVTNALGHHRTGITGAYLGSNASIKGSERAIMDTVLARFDDEEVADALRACGITRLVLAGKIACGVLDRQSLTLCAFEGSVPADGKDFADMVAVLEDAVGTHCHVLPLTDSILRQETLEVL